jgi:hypothetical protein
MLYSVSLAGPESLNNCAISATTLIYIFMVKE